MMKKYYPLLALLLIVGCASGAEKIQGYLDSPRTLLRDPHFEIYEAKRSELEKSYLHKEIDYTEYLERKGELDNDYARDVQHREKNMLSTTY
jgi:hypothetical protein